MYKKIFFPVLLCIAFLSWVPLAVQGERLPKTDRPQRPIICGQYRGPNNAQSNHWMVMFSANNITGNPMETEKIPLPLDDSGRFHLVLPAISHPGRVEIMNPKIGKWLISLDPLLIEPGDSIYFKSDSSRNNGFTVHVDIQGRGAAKYICKQAMEGMRLPLEFDVKNSLHVADSVLQLRWTFLNKYKTHLTPLAYQIMKADAAGEILNMDLNAYHQIYNKQLGKADGEELTRNFDSLKKRVVRWKASDEGNYYSTEYISFLKQLEGIGYSMEHSGAYIDCETLNRIVRENYAGLTREKLVAFTLFRDIEYYMVPEKYFQYIRKALAIIHTPYLRKMIEYQYRICKGTVPYHFDLPMDSSNKRVRLSDLKGKVVLVDMWGYACTGCYSFANAFHEKVYPLFKNDPRFMVVSIMGLANRNAYLHRLRNQDSDGTQLKEGFYYTFKDYINLYGGDEELTSVVKMVRYYHYCGFPFILLIDKEGKINCSTATSFPVFFDNDSPHIPILIDLIRSLLK